MIGNQVPMMRFATKASTYLIFLCVFIIVVYPLFWMFYSSLKPQWAIFQNVFALPTELYIDNYVEAWNTGNFGLYFLNSVIVTVPSVLGILVVSSLAGYAFARFHFRGKTLLFYFLLTGIMIPPQAVVIPSFQVISRLGLIDNFSALYVTYLSWSPVGIFILTTFFRSIPMEIEDAARVDGATTFDVFWRIALPLAKPALATVAIFYFVWVWNDFLYPLLYLQTETMNTIPMGLMLFRGRYNVDWGLQTAALSIAVSIPLLFYMFFQDKFVKGLTAGALKG